MTIHHTPRTIREVRAELSQLGLSLAKTDHGEFRVAPRCGTSADREAASYYTDDLLDALATGRSMAAHYLAERV